MRAINSQLIEDWPRKEIGLQSIWLGVNIASQLLRLILPFAIKRSMYVSASLARPIGLLYFPFHVSLSTDRASKDRSTQFRVEIPLSNHSFLTSSITKIIKKCHAA